MIEARDIQKVSDNVQSRAVGGRVYPISASEYRYVPADKSKAQRLINFLSNGRVLCCDAKTGEQCPANEHHRPCYHVLRVTLYIYRVQRRQENKAA